MAPKQTPGMSEEKRTKAQRAAERQEKARLLREQEAARKRRNKIIIVVACVLALALVTFIVVKLVSGSGKAAGDAGSYDGPAKPAQLANVGEDFGVTVDAAGAAVTVRDEALAQVGVYSNSTCPHCMQLESAVDKVVNQHMQDGSVQFTFYPLATDPVGCSNQSNWATAADFYIATYAPEQFAAFHEQLMNAEDGVYAQIPEKQQNGQQVKGYCGADDPVQPADLAAFAERVGVPADVVKSLPASVMAADWQKVAKDATDAFLANTNVCSADSCGTPTVTLDGKVVDSATYGGMDSAGFDAWLKGLAR